MRKEAHAALLLANSASGGRYSGSFGNGLETQADGSVPGGICARRSKYGESRPEFQVIAFACKISRQLVASFLEFRDGHTDCLSSHERGRSLPQRACFDVQPEFGEISTLHSNIRNHARSASWRPSFHSGLRLREALMMRNAGGKAQYILVVEGAHALALGQPKRLRKATHIICR